MPDAPAKESRRALVPADRLQFVVAVLIGGLAFAMTTQIAQDDATDYTSVRGVELVELLKSIDAANERLATQIDELTATRNDLLSSTQRSEDAEKQARKRSEQLAILAGSAGATGPGVEVTIDDPDEAVSAQPAARRGPGAARRRRRGHRDQRRRSGRGADLLPRRRAARSSSAAARSSGRSSSRRSAIPTRWPRRYASAAD